MADKNWPGRSHAPETDNEDPFAELTRIMGFDPREPVAAKQQADVSFSTDEDDLGIDLEKELMADLDPIEDVPQPREDAGQGFAQQAQGASSSSDDFYGAPASPEASAQQWDADAFSNVFDGVFQPRPVQEQASQESEQIDDFSFDLDDALANELGMQEEPRHQFDASPEPVQWPEQIPASVEQDVYALTPDAAAEQAEEAYDAREWQQPHVAHWSGEAQSAPEAGRIANDLTELNLDDFDFSETDVVAESAQPAQENDLYGVSSQWVATPASDPQSFEDELSAFLVGDADPVQPAAQPETDVAAYEEPQMAQATAKDGDKFWNEFQADMNTPAQTAQEEPTLDEFDGFELDFDETVDPQDAQPVNALQVDEPGYADDDSPFASSYAEEQQGDESYSEWQSQQEQVTAQEQVDPFAALESLSLDTFDEENDEPRMKAAFAPITATQEQLAQNNWSHADVAEASAQSVRQAVDRSRTDVPEIETIDINEGAAPLKDDLDIPEFEFEPEETVNVVEPHDDFESELSGAFGAPIRQETPKIAPPATVASAAVEDDFDNEWERDLNAAIAGAGLGVAAGAVAGGSHSPTNESQPMQEQRLGADDDLPDYASHGSSYQPVRQQIASTPRKSIWQDRSKLLMASVAGLVFLIGGAVAWGTWGDDDVGADGEPVVISADDRPVRMRPETSAGAEEPTDNKVFQTMAGNEGGAPQQETLAGGAEQPVDVSAMRQNENNLPGVDTPALAPGVESDKTEERVAPASSGAEQASDVALVTPRRVRTLVVRPDGTLAPREDQTPAPIQSQAQTGTGDVQQELIASVQPNASSVPTQTVSTTTIAPQPQPAAQTPALAPESQQQAAAPQQTTTPPAAPQAAPAAGEWSIQIASQPSREAAQASYNSLAQRYSSILGSRSYNIVAAQIEGRGTFYRVRINGGTRDQAVRLCEQYKAAGGSCFVSR
ncbi:SPOR domain-containing protein [Limoniibacter endophyticus]|uniref:Sporulation protein n=1 Tax=Limoniibacter endophyticus TaxID=1565040 RepID=A0A8J3GFH9_9HYPH|nr:SPOR domain-containing protein [Limoniibacter endophyticus]GHC62850.1 sporulation protein [Limoniibacter endophyticus]